MTARQQSEQARYETAITNSANMTNKHDEVSHQLTILKDENEKLKKLVNTSSLKGAHAELLLEQFLREHIGFMFNIENVAGVGHTCDLKLTYTFGSHFPMKVKSQNGNTSLEERFQDATESKSTLDEQQLQQPHQPLEIVFLIENKFRRKDLSCLEPREIKKFQDDIARHKPNVGVLLCPVPIFDPTQMYELRQEGDTRCYYVYTTNHQEILRVLFDGVSKSLIDILVRRRLQIVMQGLGSQPEVQDAFQNLLVLTKYAIDQVVSFQQLSSTSFNDLVPHFESVFKSFTKMQTVYPKLVTPTSSGIIQCLVQQPVVAKPFPKHLLSTNKRVRSSNNSGNKQKKSKPKFEKC